MSKWSKEDEAKFFLDILTEDGYSKDQIKEIIVTVIEQARELDIYIPGCIN